MPLAKGTTVRPQKRTKSKPPRQTEQSDAAAKAELDFALRLTPGARAARYGADTAKAIGNYEREQRKAARKVAAPKKKGGGVFGAIADVSDAVGGAILSPLEPVWDYAMNPAQHQSGGGRYTPRIPQPVQAGARVARAGTEFAVGPETARALSGEGHVNPLMLGVEAAAALPIARPFRGSRAVVAAARATRGARTIREGRTAAIRAFESTMEGPSLTPQLIQRGKRWASLRDIEPRKEAHAQIDNLIEDRITRRRVKDQVDGHVFQLTQDLDVGEREAAATHLYGELYDSISRGVHPPDPVDRITEATAGVTPDVRYGQTDLDVPTQEFNVLPPEDLMQGQRLYPDYPEKPKGITHNSIPHAQREAFMDDWLKLAPRAGSLSTQDEERLRILTDVLGLRHDTPPGSPINTPPGGGPPLPPRGTVGGTPDPDLPGGTPETAADFASERAKLRRGTQGAKGAYTRQETLRSAERRRRAGALEYQLEEGEGARAFEAGGKELRGKYPALNFHGYDELSPEALEALYEHVRTHPNLRSFEKYRTYKAITRGMRGKVPTPSDVKLLERAFGKEVTSNFKEAAAGMEKYGQLGMQIWGLPRALMSSFDLSAPFRQGLMVAVRPRYNRLFRQNFKEMHRLWGSQEMYDAAMGHIMESPNYGLYQQAKLNFTGLTDEWEQREEQFMSELAETITGGKYSPVRASSRAYTGFLNKTRADMFDLIHERAVQSGAVGKMNPAEYDHFLQSLGKFINSSTGRGSGKMLEKHLSGLTALLWSPRLLWSRLNFMNPLYYKNLHPYVRREALKSAFALVSTMAAVLGLAKMGGANVETNPANANFMKIKVGDTRVDVLGGFQQPVRTLWQIGTGTIISSTTGEEMHLGGGFGDMSRYDVAERFVRSKLNPSAALVVDLLKGRTFEGDPITVKNTVMERFLPLLLFDSFEVLREGNQGAAAVNMMVGVYGVGTQTYGATGANQGKAPAPATGGGSYGGGSGGGGGYGG